MARHKTVPITPKVDAPDDSEVEGEEETSEGAANDGTISNLGSNLPDVNDPHTSDASSPIAKMGTNNSHEEINAAVRATTSELQTRNDPNEAASGKPSAGKLKRPSRGGANPPFRNPLPAAGTQKKLAPTNNIRKSDYELEGSPTKPLPAKARATEERSAFAPRKADRRKAKQVRLSHGRVQIAC